MSKVTIMIPARAGSKGIKNKNLREINGRSLIRRAVETVKASDIDKVYIYSDSHDMLIEGKAYGAIPIERPEAVSQDMTTTEETVQQFIRDLDISGAVMVVQVTTPFLKTKYINQALDKWKCGKYDSIVSVALNQRFIGNYLKVPEEFIPQWPERQLRQNLREKTCCWFETGAFYLAKKGLWMMGQRIGRKCGVITHHRWESLEIDDEIDIEICEKLAPIIEEL